MKFKEVIYEGFEFLRRRIFLITWISLVVYLFYDTFIYYKYGQEFYYIRRILGAGLCISRGTATVLNLCAALILLPICKKSNQILYAILSQLWPGLFFFWLEKVKSIHMTVAITLSIFAVLHSISHFVNLWNFSRGYDEELYEINFANYKNENPCALLLSVPGLTGISMLVIIIAMSLTSMRIVRRKMYNAFWYTHQLHMPFVVLLIIHPLSGVLKKQIIDDDSSLYPSHIENRSNSSKSELKFVAIESRTWLWMLLPLICYSMDLLWRIFTRNCARVEILQATLMSGRTISLTLSCPHDGFVCRAGQYVLLQCLELSLIEWHPFTVVEVPKPCQRYFVVWIRVKGDWTEALQNILEKPGPSKLSLLIDGPFSSPMEGPKKSSIAICVAAGVGITPFVSLLQDILSNPRSRSPGRLHLLWIVRHEEELVWLAELANRTILEIRNANRPDRLHLELYITSPDGSDKINSHVVVMDESGIVSHVLKKKGVDDSENFRLLTTLLNKNTKIKNSRDVCEKIAALVPRVKQNNEKIQNVIDDEEIVPFLNVTSNRIVSMHNKKEKAIIFTPNINKSHSKTAYLDDGNERNSLLTPNLKRQNSVAKYICPYVENGKTKNINNYEHTNHTTKVVDSKFHENIFNEKSTLNSLHRNNYTCEDAVLNNKKRDKLTNLLFDNSVYDRNKSMNTENYVNVNYVRSNVVANKIMTGNGGIKLVNRDFGAIKKGLEIKEISRDNTFDISKEYPLLACRVRKGRPHWDRTFGYWVHLYPGEHLNIYCCGPKKLVKILKKKCKQYSRDTKTTFKLIHEAFS